MRHVALVAALAIFCAAPQLASADQDRFGNITTSPYGLTVDGGARQLKADDDGTAYVKGTFVAASPDGGSPTVYVRPGASATYLASTNGVVGSGTSAATVSVAYLWHPNTNTKRAELDEVKCVVSGATVAVTPTTLTLALYRITAENGTPGGTSQTINQADPADATTTDTFRTGAAAPTRAAGIYSSDAVVVGTATLPATTLRLYDPSSGPVGKAPAARASTAEGYEVAAIVGAALATAATISCDFRWTEQ